MAPKKYKNPIIIGVTGGIGSGQSTVSSFLQQMRCKVISADIKAKELIQKDRGLQGELKKTFGNDIFTKNRQLDTKRLAEIAFSSQLQTQKLNQLVHPRMVASLIEEMEQARFSGRYPLIIIDAALIYEISIERMFDYIIVVNTSLPLRMKRVNQRDGMTQKQFKERAGKQIPLADKVKWADFVIDNNSSLEALKESTKKIYNDLMQKQRKVEHKKIN